MWNAWREHNKDVRPDLSGATLREADLRGADLTDTTLSRTTLREADISRPSTGCCGTSKPRRGSREVHGQLVALLGVIRSQSMKEWKDWRYASLWRGISRVLCERSRDRDCVAFAHPKAVCPGELVLWPSIRHAWSDTWIALLPPERPGGHRQPGRLHRKDRS
jgi:hypothetical protein